ncbi:MAG: glycosyltransferase [Rhodocyclaceae bacterium]
MTRCLWISREIPFPADAGDRIYSASMARALHEAGVQVRLLGFDGAAPPPADWPVEVRGVPGERNTAWRALVSSLPLAAALHATPAYADLLTMQLREPWDFIVIDSYGSGWALDACLQLRDAAQAKGQLAPVLVYLSHNHEESLWRSLAREGASLLRRLMLRQNYWKVRALEQRLVREVHLVAAITAEDADSYARQVADKRTVVLTPGYSGPVMPERDIVPACPRRVLLIGSFRWVVKQENLRRFLEIADARFEQSGIECDVIGDVPRELLERLQGRMHATRFYGFLDDVKPFLASARMAVVPEFIGGGFKLKYLDYIFGRVPVATISAAAAGLPDGIRDNMLCRDDMGQLVDGIVETINQTDKLDVMQKKAFEEARAHFQWADRGRQFRQALEGAT